MYLNFLNFKLKSLNLTIPIGVGFLIISAARTVQNFVHFFKDVSRFFAIINPNENKQIAENGYIKDKHYLSDYIKESHFLSIKNSELNPVKVSELCQKMKLYYQY